MNTEILYRSPNLKVFRKRPQPSRFDVIVVSFQYRQTDQHLDLPGFAEGFLTDAGIDAVFVNCATNEWYQYPDLPLALSAVRLYGSHAKRIVTYGSSMGGYAALRFAKEVCASTSIAVGPQYSPKPIIITGENRFNADIASTHFLHEDRYRISADVYNWVIYDPLLTLDTSHVQKYREEANIIPIPIPCGGHTPTILLSECRLLDRFILELLSGTFCAARFRNAFRKKRPSSTQYWRELADRLREHGRPLLAERVSHVTSMAN